VLRVSGVKSGQTMILACTRLNWQIHLPERLIRKAHKRSNSTAKTGLPSSNLWASRERQPGRNFRHMIGRPKRPVKRKNSDVTWCYNHRAGLTLFGSTPAATPNKLLNTPVGGFLHRIDAAARMLRLRPVVLLARSLTFCAADENIGRTQAVRTWRS
jgi:hypothetical protein